MEQKSKEEADEEWKEYSRKKFDCLGGYTIVGTLSIANTFSRDEMKVCVCESVCPFVTLDETNTKRKCFDLPALMRPCKTV